MNHCEVARRHLRAINSGNRRSAASHLSKEIIRRVHALIRRGQGGEKLDRQLQPSHFSAKFLAVRSLPGNNRIE